MFNPKMLEQLIIESNLTREGVAKNIGIAGSSLRKYLSGEVVPSVNMMCRIADYFGVTLDSLCERAEGEYSKVGERRRIAYEQYLMGYLQPERPTVYYGARSQEAPIAPWPYNLMDVIAGEPINWIVKPENEEGLRVEICRLLKNEQKVLLGVYRDHRTQIDIAKELDVTKARVRQIHANALRKLRHVSSYKMIFSGIHSEEEFNQMVTDKEAEFAKREEDLKRREEAVMEALKEVRAVRRCKLSEDVKVTCKRAMVVASEDIKMLDLSVRAYNGLCRAGITTIGKLEEVINAGELHKVRCLGPKCQDEIVTKFKAWGF